MAITIMGGLHPRKTVVALMSLACAVSFLSIYLQLSLINSCQQDFLQDIRTGMRRGQPPQHIIESPPASSVINNSPDHSLETTLLHLEQQQGPRRARVLFGIFTADFREERRYRKKLRELFALHPRLCFLADFTSNRPDACEIVYTFVAGGNPNGLTELLDDSLPMLATKPVPSTSADFNYPDVTLLNIRENMNEGKSQTWFKYASEIMEAYEIDYVAKSDTDTLLYLDQLLAFIDENLPPAPYNRNVLAGSIADKWWWGDLHSEENKPTESFFIDKFGKDLHLYVEGQCYIMSKDLAQTVAREAAKGNRQDFLEGHEDHDISAFAWHSSKPIKLVIIALEQRFWQHRVKLKLGSNFHRIWDSEILRITELVGAGQVEKI